MAAPAWHRLRGHDDGASRVVLLTAAIGGPENGSTVLRSPDTVAHYDELRACDRRGRAAHAGSGAACHRPPPGPGEQRSDVRRAGWNWGKGHAGDGASWPRRLWFSAGDLVAWGLAFLPHQVRRSDGSVNDVTGAYLVYQVHPGHAGLVDEVIDWYDSTAADIERTVRPSAADEFALKRW